MLKSICSDNAYEEEAVNIQTQKRISWRWFSVWMTF
jgi:hypothetical protein